MCGIAGIISNGPAGREQLQLMTAALAHRGPDGEACWNSDDGHAALGHRRLAIIDTSPAAAQPMHYANRYTIVHNGEIYNYIELKARLQQLGYHFTTQSDTEVILAAYQHWQQHCLAQFDGMFAFAVYDRQTQTLFAARDRMGEKPFHYFFDEAKGTFIFGSEIKALWAAGVPRQVNNRLLLAYLSSGTVQHPADKSATFFEQVFSLPPGCSLTVSPRAVRPVISKYWQPAAEAGNAISPEAAAEKFGALLQASVQRRLRSDVPVGTSLSGGIDSAGIAALLGSSHQYTTFSAVFPGFAKDEAAAIAEVTGALQLTSCRVTPDAAGLLQDFEKLCFHQEQPFGSAGIYAQYKVYELAKQQGVTVLLDGQGADELLGGYTRYLHWYLQELWRHSRAGFEAARKALAANGLPVAWGIANVLAALFPGLAARRLAARAAAQRHPGISRDFYTQYHDKTIAAKPVIKNLNDLLLYDTTVLGLEELLRYADRNSMAHGREVRLPYLEPELAAFVFSLPAACKIKDGHTKWILRRFLSSRLPASIVWNSKKTGFEPPQQQWMLQPAVQDYIHEARRKLVQQGILQAAVLQQPVQPQAAYAANNYDWRCMAAAGTLFA